MSVNYSERESVIQERVNLLREEGYRGFQLEGGRAKAENSVQVGALDVKGVRLTADGDTLDEAYENLIERIDYLLDS
ncbi:MAG: hypothetical protein EA360_06375 [Balneolaceae bacterium]|nr:MAG: hypothetical protein EA360_06375 [Balneolaceae bacterium]